MGQISPAERAHHEVGPFEDLISMPEGAVLFFKRHQVSASCRASVAAGIMQQHQAQKRHVLRIAGHEGVENSREPDCLDA